MTYNKLLKMPKRNGIKRIILNDPTSNTETATGRNLSRPRGKQCIIRAEECRRIINVRKRDITNSPVTGKIQRKNTIDSTEPKIVEAKRIWPENE